MPLVVFAVVFGVYPRLVLDYMQPSVDKTVVELTEWTRRHEAAIGASTEVADADETPEVTREPIGRVDELSDVSLPPADRAAPLVHLVESEEGS